MEEDYCSICGFGLLDPAEVFVSEDQEKCHRRCLERKIVSLELKGVRPELVDVLLESFKPAKKKKRFWGFG
ncbi:MAG: hypothetical protein A2508_07490 [Candidatus Lambdaproteobacteria bacterium RIFOXYD12_FULL_49_8]|uniref:Uncharacterized protein n=1 Tax=Candidatus Lambdaproteobacteria bacterium RIFOXYD2_FULL_50_16 TaxID=1817772 RepID=A0A1F6GAQ9_9PROT|nr:MAG: hypothetical protein A2527_08475 [Candidatus Lambdaproteobacteria bacterium RIFOXYD2_FULL_50_16]OGG98099.1 MAG: hypothetical protein A2508_07490 [Candidatus Lambdaproteobacteria bacterium RIFOXYD12_FULL_49_8]